MPRKKTISNLNITPSILLDKTKQNHLQHIPKMSTVSNLKKMSPFCQQNKTKKLRKTFPLQLSDILGDLYYFA